MAIRAGIGYDIHKKKKGRKLVLGGIAFESNWGLDGHSDADVLLHAIGDALLGALALGDIGKHFPPDDEKWKNASSLEMLKVIASMIRGRGGRIVNVDAMLIAEEPKVSEKRDAMRGAIGEALRLGLDAVSVKATTNETLGAIGRGEGLAAMAIAMVEVP